MKTFSYPDRSLFIVDNIPQIVPPAFDYGFASGGVVTGPTRALIGEAGRAEMVMPLDNSPQMQEFISEIVSAINQNSQRDKEIRVYLDGKSLSRALYSDMKNETARRGYSLVN